MIFPKFASHTNIKPFRSVETLPIWNWTKAKQDLRYLLQLSDYDNLPKYKKDLTVLWQSLQDEFLEKVGQSDERNYYLGRTKKLIQLQLDEIIYEDGHPKKSRTKVDLKNLTDEMVAEANKKPQSLEEQTVMLESYFKVVIDIRRTSVLKFYKYLENYEREQSQNISRGI